MSEPITEPITEEPIDDVETEVEVKIPSSHDLKFKSPGNDDITLSIFNHNHFTEFDYRVSHKGVLIPEDKNPLTNMWYSKKGEINGICSHIERILKPTKKGMHKEGMKAELTEWAKMVIKPLVKTPLLDRNKFFTELDGNIIRHTLSPRAENYIDNVITNFVFDMEDRIINIDTNDVEYKGTITCGSDSVPFSIDSNTLSDKRLFITALNKTGLKVVFNHQNVADIIQAFQHFISENGDIKTTRKTSKMGWYEYDEDTSGPRDYYLSKSIKIDYYGIHKNEDMVIEIPKEGGVAKYLDLDIISDTDFQICGIHIMDELMKLHDPYFMRVSLAKTFGAPYLKEISRHSDEAKYPTEYVGAPQSGKSLIERLMQCFFGHFPFEENGFLTFGDTINSMYTPGSYYNDVLLLLDDLKRTHLSNPRYMGEVSTMYHNYVSVKGRARQTGENSPAMQGSMVVTTEGKTSDEGDASRLLSVFVPKVEKNFELKEKCIKMRELYPGFMARFIHWNIHNNFIDTEKLLLQYRNMFSEKFKEVPNVDVSRFSNMYAITLLEYQRFLAFMVSCKFITADVYEKEINEFVTMLITKGKESVSMLSDSDPVNKFITTIKSIISSGGVIIIDEKNIIPEEKSKPVIGRIKGGVLYLIPDISTEVVNHKLRMYNIQLNKDSLTNGFDERNMLIEKNDKSNLRGVRIGKPVIGCWAFDKTIFGYESEPSLDMKISIPAAINAAIKKSGVEEKPSMSGSQYENIKIAIYESLHFKETDIGVYGDMIDIALSSVYLAKGWSKVIIASL